MADQIAIRLPKTQVEEEASFVATVSFRDRETDAASTPTTIDYRIDDITSQKVIVDWTSVTPASSVTITVPSSANEIKQNSSAKERKQLIVQTDRLLSTKSSNSARWWVTNIYGISVA